MWAIRGLRARSGTRTLQNESLPAQKDSLCWCLYHEGSRAVDDKVDPLAAMRPGDYSSLKAAAGRDGFLRSMSEVEMRTAGAMGEKSLR